MKKGDKRIFIVKDLARDEPERDTYIMQKLKETGMTVQEFAKFMKVNRSTVYRWCAKRGTKQYLPVPLYMRELIDFKIQQRNQ